MHGLLGSECLPRVRRERSGVVTIMMIRSLATAAMVIAGFVLAGCGGAIPPAPPVAPAVASSEYRIGIGDTLQVFVWRNPEISTSATSSSEAGRSAGAPVRPDGRISLPLVSDIVAAGKTPAELARDIEQRLSVYLRHPIVSVIDTNFVGSFSRQIRIIGQAVQPHALPYRANMTVLDAMIAVGGLSKYAAGDRATLLRAEGGVRKTYALRLDSLMNDGKLKYNVALAPGDIVVIPESYF